MFETLERRELLASDFPASVDALLARVRVKDFATYQATGNFLTQGSSGGSTVGANSPGNGEPGNLLSVVEVEPNDIMSRAQFVPLSSSQWVNYIGNFATTADTDYVAFDLKRGDILNTRISAVSSTLPLLGLFNASGTELLLNQGLFNGGFYQGSSPLFEDGNTTLPYIIDTDGRYFMRISDGIGPYTLSLRVHRSTYEAEPVGTQQIIYVDFDGSLLQRETLGVFTLPTGTVRVPPLSRAMQLIGLTEADTPAVVANIMSRLSLKMQTWLASDSNNGFYPSTGRPGDFSVRLVSSYDSPDMWGMPNVTRIAVGGTDAELGIATPFRGGLFGVAESVDIGNFDREETALVIAEIHATFARDRVTIPISGSVTVADVFAEMMADTIAHEAGHTLGSVHQDPFNSKLTIMDQFPPPRIIGVGLDGIFGTRDDASFRFLTDEYTPLQTPFGGGVNNDPNVLAYGMSTGKVGGTVAGLVYNDINRNARQDGSETGLSSWLVYVDLNNNGSRDSGEPSSTTDSSGRYSIAVGAGSYNLRVVYPAGWIASTSSEAFKTVTVSTNATANANFGASFPQVGATGFKWLDLNGDGVRDQNEPGLAGVYIYLDLDLDGRPDIGEPAAITKDDGSYTLSPPNPGTFRIREVVEPGYVQTFPTSGFHTAVFNGNTPLSGFDFGNRESSDWGDAPSPYPTTRAQGGASHGVLPGFRLGANWDAELDGANSANADGDDLNAAVDDEDGITLLSPIVRGDSQNSIRISVVNTASSAAYLQGWIDFNGNGSWGDPGERIVSDLPVSAGDTIVNFTTPASAVSRTAARFRLSATTGVGPTGRTAAGEVEDYIYNIVDGPRRNVQDDRFTVNRNSISNPLDVLANDFLPPNDSIAAIQLSAPSQGGSVVNGVDNVLRYTPARGFFGQESFTYTIVFGSGRRETANVTVSVVLQFIDPVALDDSFDIPTNSTSFPLNVLLNDIEGKNGPLTITSVSTPNQGGSAVIGSGGLSIRYTPQNGFGGTERFTYTAVDGAGKTTTANITIHTLGGDRLDDEAQFSFAFFDMSGNPITRVLQGDQFQVYVYTYDLRREKAIGVVPAPPAIVDPGVYAAYLDVLYNSKIVLPASPSGGTPLDFANAPQNNYTSGVSGTAQFPGVLQSLGAFYSQLTPPPFSLFNPTLFQKLTFTANAAGLAEFVGDPANQSPNTDVVLYNPPNSPVPVEKVRYLRSTIEVLPRGVELPFAVDDSPAALPLNTTSVIDVLRNDIVGTAGPIQISNLTQPARGTVSIDTRGTSSTSDDRIQFIPFSSTLGFSDQFTYTITDTRGFSSTATVTIQVGDSSVDDQVRLVLETHAVGAPANATPISTIPVGGEFELRGYVQDIRTPTPTGVFAAYQDILYDAGLVAVKSSSGPLGFEITFSSKYPNGPSGDVRIPGLINEVGSFADTTPIGSGKFEQFRIKMKANTAGNARFAGDPADISPFNDTLVYGSRDKIPYNRISFVPATITIGGTSSGGGEGHTNPNNRFDVNSDNFVSPIDVLLLINLLNQGQGGALETRPSGGPAEGEDGDNYYVDVDSDGFFTPLDALLIINELNGRAISGEGEGAAPPIVEIRSTASQRSDASIEISLTDSLAVAVGPQMASSNASASINDVDGYLASLVDGDDEEEEGVDDFLGDLVRVRFQS